MPEKLLFNLNPQQREAVQFLDGPLLVLAGAGSGKTGVLTHKIAYLLGSKIVDSTNILAVTFTNKAANEMKIRIEKLIESQISKMWIGTFHSICARILRSEGKHIGYSSNFTIYDSDDQLKQIQNIMTFLNIDQSLLKPKQIQYAISNSKSQMQNASDFEKSAVDFKKQRIAEVFWEYESALRRNNAFDFDDLLLKPLEIFTLHKDILKKYQDKFGYILVDEYQDTNKSQYHLVKMLSAVSRKICVVGDEDQSIYKWRGADIENILSFEKDFPQCKIIRLEQNYRSTQTILDAANFLVANNLKRLGKNLWSAKNSGEKIRLIRASNESMEAAKVKDIILDFQSDPHFTLNNVAVLYRTNAQSRALEDQMRRAGIPYILVGGVRFYERKEIKDIIAYLRILVNPDDSNSMRRIINYPTRAIGNITLKHLSDFSRKNDLSLYETLATPDAITEINAGTKARLKSFHESLEQLREQVNSISAYKMAAQVIQTFGLRDSYLHSESQEDKSRLENINELLNSISLFVKDKTGENNNLQHYLQEVSLLTDIDSWDNISNAITLMTLHSAKGLEFPIVIITGLEDGLFPIFRSMDNNDDLEEERRLFYVGMTRAKERLFLLWASQRHRFQNSEFGMSNRNIPSRFLKEIPSKYLEEDVKSDMLEFDFEENHGREFKYSGRNKKSELREFRMEASGFSIGQWVYHESFGKGQILGIQGSNSGTKLTVVFPKNQIKKIIAEYANLQIVTSD
jgi:DNA helicase-2/ATP-dependent DNA helicase PcrA